MNQETLVMVALAVSLVSVLVAALAVARISVLSRHVSRLADQIPGTGMTAKELAAELGASIESSFQQFMPRPENVSGAITSAVETTLKTAAANVESLHAKLLDGQDAVLDKWVAHEKNSTGALEAIRQGLDTVSREWASGLSGGSQKMQASLDEGARQLTAAVADLTARMDTALKDHAAKTTEASTMLAAQLEKIVRLEQEIDKLLHLQEATEGTIKGVASSAAFMELIKGVKAHLETSDKALQEIARPRTIRLVEQDA